MDTIGKMLSEERTKKGLDHIDVEHATGIRAMYVKALEEGHYGVLPGDVYVRGFIRNYGNFLGLDGARLVHLYAESNVEHEQPSREHHGTKPDKKTSGGRKWIVLFLVILTLSIAGGVLYSWQKTAPIPVQTSKPSPPAQTQAGAQPSVSQVQPGSTVKPPSVPSAVPSALPSAVQPVKGVTLVARFTDRCWTSAIADGRTVYEGIPRIGETLTWEADRIIVVNLGNAAAAEISFNGQPQTKMGERGEVVVKTFAAPAPSTALPAVRP